MAEDQSTHDGLLQVLVVLRRRAILILLLVIVAGGAAFGLSATRTKKYTATTSVLFSDNQTAEQVAGLQAVSETDQQAQQDTNVQLLQLGSMASQTAKALGLTKKQVKAAIAVAPEGDTNVVTVSATNANPSLAAKIANTYSQNFVDEQVNGQQGYYSSALAVVRRQLAAMSAAQRASTSGLALEARAQSLSILAQPSLQSAEVQIAQLASVPTSPSSPKVVEDVLIGALLGFVIGVGLAFALDRLDRRIHDVSELADIYEVPVLGRVPRLSSPVRFDSSDGQPTLALDAREAFQMLRGRLRYFNVDKKFQVLAVLSAEPADGKTTVAHRLALEAAASGATTLLIDADLRRPRLHSVMSLDNSLPGLGDVLIGAAPFMDSLQEVKFRTKGPSESDHSIFVLGAGGILPPNPTELLESHAMASLLQEARDQFDFVVIDTPPLEVVPDAFPLLTIVDGAVVVSRLNRDNRDAAKRLHETLVSVSAPLIGVVANEADVRGASYGYGYSYGADGESSSQRKPSASESSTGSDESASDETVRAADQETPTEEESAL